MYITHALIGRSPFFWIRPSKNENHKSTVKSIFVVFLKLLKTKTKKFIYPLPCKLERIIHCNFKSTTVLLLFYKTITLWFPF